MGVLFDDSRESRPDDEGDKISGVPSTVGLVGVVPLLEEGGESPPLGSPLKFSTKTNILITHLQRA